MKKTTLLKTMLLLCALIVGSGSVWAETKTEDFEKQSTSTTYNSTQTYTAANSNCGIAWTMYYGTVSTNDKISGSNSAQMRWYSGDAVTNIPYVKTTTAIDGLSNVSLKARTSNLNVKMDVCYSANGSDWTVGKTHTFSKTGTGESVSLDIPSGNKYVKFEVNSSSTAPSSGNYKLIVDDVVFTYTSDKEEATWTLDPTSATIMEGQSTTLQLTTNYDGTLNFESEDTDIATVSYNTSTKVITVTGVAVGSTTITVTGDATATYSAIDKSIDVTVTHEELANNFFGTISNFGYSYFGLTPTGSSTYVETASVSKTDAIGVSLEFSKVDGNNVRFDGSYVRFYKKNTLTVTAPTGSYITKIVFTEPSTDKAWNGSMTTGATPVGDYVSSEKTWYATETGTTSVVFTNDNTKRIGGMKVYLMATKIPVPITSAGFATLYSGNALDFSDLSSELTAYTATVAGSTVTLTPVDDIPANTGVVLKGTAKTHYVPVIASSSTAKGDLTGNTTAATAYNAFSGYDLYMLALNGKNEAQFTLANAGEIAAGKAFLKLIHSGSRSLSVVFADDETTAIRGIENGEMKVKNSFFDLQGRRVAQPTKGLYIVNGKKVIIK